MGRSAAASAAKRLINAHNDTGRATFMDFRLPELGEGIADATVTRLLVKPGDAVAAGQSVVEVETDKASVEVPCDAAGIVAEVRVKVGQKIKIGDVILALTAGARRSRPPLRSRAAGRRLQKAAESPKNPPPADAGGSPKTPKREAAPAIVTANGPVPAGPATRHFARDLGVNLAEVGGTARGGRVTVDDVKSHVRDRMAGGGGGGIAIPPLPDFAKYGPVERKPVSNLRKKIAENLTLSWHVAPAVTQFDLSDITDLEGGRKRIVDALPKGAPKITMTVLAIKAVVAALKEFPHFNSAYDVPAGELVVKQYYHVGIAVDTERGLVVPVIRDADKKSIRDLAKEVAELAEKARAGKLAIEDMRGGGFTITNLGGVGGTAFSPIINYPEVAILGLSRSTLQPVVRNGAIEARLMLPLSLTYDHRVIDGADGARFTTRLAQLFGDPIRLLMES